MITKEQIEAAASELFGEPVSVVIDLDYQMISLASATRHRMIKLKRYDIDKDIADFAAERIAPLV